MSVVRALVPHEVVVVLPEQVDLCNAARVAEELICVVSRSGTVIIDMSATTFCDCAGARAVVRAHTRASDSGAELRLVVTAPLVRRVFGLMGVDRLVDFYPSMEAARGRALVLRPGVPQAGLVARARK